MTFGKYFVNTSWKQKKYDWYEYEMLKMDIDVARHNLNIMYNNLVYHVEEDVYNSKNACVKNLIIKSDFRQRSPEIENKQVVSAVIKSRCIHFAPEKDEVLCPCTDCECFAKNKKYYYALQRLKKLEAKYNGFWTRKFQQATK